jgi:hypothetical protein
MSETHEAMTNLVEAARALGCSEQEIARTSGLEQMGRLLAFKANLAAEEGRCPPTLTGQRRRADVPSTFRISQGGDGTHIRARWLDEKLHLSMSFACNEPANAESAYEKAAAVLQEAAAEHRAHAERKNVFVWRCGTEQIVIHPDATEDGSPSAS